VVLVLAVQVLERLVVMVQILFFQLLLQLVVVAAVHLATPQAMADQEVGAVIKVLALLVELEQQTKVEMVVMDHQVRVKTVLAVVVHLWQAQTQTVNLLV
jgi:hypothetical protein